MALKLVCNVLAVITVEAKKHSAGLKDLLMVYASD